MACLRWHGWGVVELACGLRIVKLRLLHHGLQACLTLSRAFGHRATRREASGEDRQIPKITMFSTVFSLGLSSLFAGK